MLFEWDEEKRQSNLAKHYIDFRDAVRVFDGPVFETAGSRRGKIASSRSARWKTSKSLLSTQCAASDGGLFQQGGRIAMKGKITRTTSNSRTKGKTDFRRLRQMRDADIDDSDIPKLDRSFWKHAKLTMPEPKDRLTIRVDHDVVEWLKRAGSGYQTRINAILRSYMKAQLE
jgi:uncharacterized protein (DUF4415 family)